jgi:hypothetical protein
MLPMRVRLRFSIPLVFVLLLLPLLTEDPILGTWRMREDRVNPSIKSQVMKVEEVPGGTRFTFDIVTTKTKFSYFYVTKLDGEAVSAIMKKKPFSTVRVKKISPLEYETTVTDLTTEQHFTSTISKDGTTLTNAGTAQANGQTLAVHQVFERAK